MLVADFGAETKRLMRMPCHIDMGFSRCGVLLRTGMGYYI